MNKKTILIVSLTLLLAIMVIVAIATFPTYLFKDDTMTSSTPSNIQIGEEDVTVGGNGNGIEATLPDIEATLNSNNVSKNESEVSPEGTSDLNLTTISEAKGAVLKAELGSFSRDAKVVLKKLGILNKNYYLARHYTKDIAKRFIAYSFTAKENGKTVLPIGSVQMVITVPEKYDINNVSVYYLLSDGGVQELNCKIDKVAGTVAVNATSTGVYILVEKKAQKVDSPADDTTVSESDTTTSSDDQESITPDDNSSESSDTTSSDNAEPENPEKDTMSGWTPWY